MSRTFLARNLQKDNINDRIRKDPKSFVLEEHQRYLAEVRRMAEGLTHQLSGRGLVLLSGPSGAGKTTTSTLLCRFLEEQGVRAYTVSLDNFYRGRHQAPLLPDGSYDYESPEALDLPQIQRCMREIVEYGETELPEYNFEAGAPAEHKIPLSVGDHAIVIFEGIHSLHPEIARFLPKNSMQELFVNTLSRVYDGDQVLLARRDIRLIRRLLRDKRFRGSSLENTLHMWQQVTRGEELYLFPNTDTVDVLIDTTHAFEPCLFAGELLELLRTVSDQHPMYPKVQHLIEALSQFEVMSPDLIPSDSLMREFIG